MLISHRKRFIYTKTVKTAGTSVEVYFEPWCLPEGTWSFSHARAEADTAAGVVGYRGPDASGSAWWNHMPAAVIRARVAPEVWAEYFKFCVIRDPFDKAVSAFHHVERQARGAGLGWRERLLALLGRGDTPSRFRRWVSRGGLPQDRDKYFIDGELAVDHFIRYEHLADDVRTVCERLDIPWNPEALPRLKAGTRPAENLASYYDAETAARVAAAFAWEVERFGYRAPH